MIYQAITIDPRIFHPSRPPPAASVCSLLKDLLLILVFSIPLPPPPKKQQQQQNNNNNKTTTTTTKQNKNKQQKTQKTHTQKQKKTITVSFKRIMWRHIKRRPWVLLWTPRTSRGRNMSQPLWRMWRTGRVLGGVSYIRSYGVLHRRINSLRIASWIYNKKSKVFSDGMAIKSNTMFQPSHYFCTEPLCRMIHLLKVQHANRS